MILYLFRVLKLALNFCFSRLHENQFEGNSANAQPYAEGRYWAYSGRKSRVLSDSTELLGSAWGSAGNLLRRFRRAMQTAVTD